jgi:cytochrome c oxidase assembly protein subunit 11
MSRKRAPTRDPAVRRTGVKLALVALGMFAFGYALVPLYDVICEVTGLNGKTGRAEATVAAVPDEERWVTVEFTGSTQAGLPWEFRPQQKSLRVHPGAVAVAYYEVRNGAGEAITGQAVPSVAPNKAAAHFKKIECFCFTQQTLKAGETRSMPVRFVVDTRLPKDVHTVTLSYAFFNSDKESAARYGGGAPAEAAAHDHSQHAGHTGG